MLIKKRLNPQPSCSCIGKAHARLSAQSPPLIKISFQHGGVWGRGAEGKKDLNTPRMENQGSPTTQTHLLGLTLGTKRGWRGSERFCAPRFGVGQSLWSCGGPAE